MSRNLSNRTDPIKPAFAESFPPTPHGIPAPWIRVAGVLVLASLILQHGFPISSVAHAWLDWVNLLLTFCFGADLMLALFRERKWRRVLQVRRLEFVVLVLLLLVLGVGWLLPASIIGGLRDFFHARSDGVLTFNVIKLFLLVSVCIQLLRGIQRLFGKGVRPELILAGSFATLIVVGSLLLLLPNSSAKPGDPIGGMDAFFTATSAVCVTGLVVRDTGTAFSSFGQTVIMVLFQMGGLGIITFVGFLSIFSTRALPVPQMVAFRQLVNAPRFSDLKRQIIGILVATGVIELIGTVLIYQFLPGDGDPLDRLIWSAFHSVSAFCNAGFALQADSLELYHGNAGLMFTVMGLVILGGLGFLAISEVLGYRLTRMPWFRRFNFFRRLHTGQAMVRFSVQTRLALYMTAALLVLGCAGFWVLEFSHMLEDRPAGDSFLIAAFQSVTARTAGFNTVPIHKLQDATLVFMMMLMVVGASPVSMGGGIKTVGFGILLLALRAMVMRRDRVEAFGRTIPTNMLFAALSVFVLYVLSASVGIFLLALFDPEMRLQDQAFEVISALSTVGLSTGITADLSPASKIVLCVAMFVGRVGPISLVLSVFHSRRSVTYEYPEEEVVVG